MHGVQAWGGGGTGMVQVWWRGCGGAKGVQAGVWGTQVWCRCGGGAVGCRCGRGMGAAAGGQGNTGMVQVWWRGWGQGAGVCVGGRRVFPSILRTQATSSWQQGVGAPVEGAHHPLRVLWLLPGSKPSS